LGDRIEEKAAGIGIPQTISFRGTGGHILRGKWASERRVRWKLN